VVRPERHPAGAVLREALRLALLASASDEQAGGLTYKSIFDFRELFAFCDLHASRYAPGGLVTEGWLEVVRASWSWPRYFDRQGFPIPGREDGTDAVLVWAEMKEHDTPVAQSDFPDGSLLSTIWLGLDHNFGGRPLFFETMYFSAEVDTAVLPTGHEFDFHPTLAFPNPYEEGAVTEQLRYGNEEEALACHHAITRLLRKRWLV
jgi:hypothetical protein